MKPWRKLTELRDKILNQYLPNNANHATANFYCSFRKMEILKQKNTSVDVPNTRKLVGLQQARHSHAANRTHQPRPNNLHILTSSTQLAFCSKA